MAMEQAYFCQSCRARLVLVRGDSEQAGDRRAEPWLTPLNASVFDSGKIDESFIVLDARRASGRHMVVLSVHLWCSWRCWDPP